MLLSLPAFSAKCLCRLTGLCVCPFSPLPLLGSALWGLVCPLPGVCVVFYVGPAHAARQTVVNVKGCNPTKSWQLDLRFDAFDEQRRRPTSNPRLGATVVRAALIAKRVVMRRIHALTEGESHDESGCYTNCYTHGPLYGPCVWSSHMGWPRSGDARNGECSFVSMQ